MPQKRPSYPSIRARQRRLLEYIGSTGKTDRQAAKDLGVTPQQLRKFTSTKSTNLRRNFSRSKAYTKLYNVGTEKQLRQKAKAQGKTVKFRQVREYSEASIQQFRTTPGYDQTYVTRYVQTGEQIQQLYTRDITPQYLWAVYTRENGLPISIKSIRILRRNGRMSRTDYQEALTVWQNVYSIGAERYSSFSE